GDARHRARDPRADAHGAPPRGARRPVDGGAELPLGTPPLSRVLPRRAAAGPDAPFGAGKGGGVKETARLLARIRPYLRPFRGRLLVAVALVFGISAAEILKPWPLKIVIDNALGGKPMPLVGYPGHVSAETLLALSAVGLVVLYVVLGALSVASNYVTI